MGNFGFQEILFIFVVALIFFGPRKLPELGRTLGQTLGQFKRASEDFKRSWETEVEMERRRLLEDEAPKIAPAENTQATAPKPELNFTPPPESVAYASLPVSEPAAEEAADTTGKAV